MPSYIVIDLSSTRFWTVKFNKYNLYNGKLFCVQIEILREKIKLSYFLFLLGELIFSNIFLCHVCIKQ